MALHEAHGGVLHRRVWQAHAERRRAGVRRGLANLLAGESDPAVGAPVEIAVEHPDRFGRARNVFLQHHVAQTGRLHLAVAGGQLVAISSAIRTRGAEEGASRGVDALEDDRKGALARRVPAARPRIAGRPTAGVGTACSWHSSYIPRLLDSARASPTRLARQEEVLRELLGVVVNEHARCVVGGDQDRTPELIGAGARRSVE